MTDINQIITDRSIPNYIQSEYPYFVSFLSGYYEWLEQQKYSIDITKNLKNYRNIDETLDEYIDYFQSEYLNKFPKNLLVDKSLLIKHIKDFYLNKGNQQSYKFLFRILYDEDISFYFPGDDVLRASDGKWYQRSVIKIQLNSVSDVDGVQNQYVTGVTSGAIGGIESLLIYEERGNTVAEITVNVASGEFVSGEKIKIGATEFNSFDCYSSATVTNQGSEYVVGDIIPLKDSTDSLIGLAEITNTTRGPITEINVVSGGKNYNGNQQVIDQFYALPINYTWNGMYLPDTPIFNPSGYDFASQPINFSISEEIIEGTGDIVNVSDSSNSGGYGAYGVVEQVGNDGEILSVSVINEGDLYETPVTSIDTDTGSGAELSVVGGGGGVKNVQLDTLPIYLTGDSGIYLDFSNKGDGTATASLSHSILATYPGYWLNEDGQLSSNKKLQDNYFYQDFSYVLKVSKAISEWKDFIKDIVHPLGTQVFGELQIVSNVGISIENTDFLTDYIITKEESISIGVESTTIITSDLYQMTWADEMEVAWADDTLIKWGA